MRFYCSFLDPVEISGRLPLQTQHPLIFYIVANPLFKQLPAIIINLSFLWKVSGWGAAWIKLFFITKKTVQPVLLKLNINKSHQRKTERGIRTFFLLRASFTLWWRSIPCRYKKNDHHNPDWRQNREGAITWNISGEGPKKQMNS